MRAFNRADRAGIAGDQHVRKGAYRIEHAVAGKPHPGGSRDAGGHLRHYRNGPRQHDHDRSALLEGTSERPALVGIPDQQRDGAFTPHTADPEPGKRRQRHAGERRRCACRKTHEEPGQDRYGQCRHSDEEVRVQQQHDNADDPDRIHGLGPFQPEPYVVDGENAEQPPDNECKGEDRAEGQHDFEKRSHRLSPFHDLGGKARGYAQEDPQGLYPAYIDGGPIRREPGNDHCGNPAGWQFSTAAPMCHCGIDQRKENLLHCNIRVLQLIGQRLREDVQSSLGGAIDRGTGLRSQRQAGIDVHDHSGARLHQAWQQKMNEGADGSEIDIDLAPDGFVAEIRIGKAGGVLHSRIVDQHVDRPGGFRQRIGSTLNGAEVGKIGFIDVNIRERPTQCLQSRGRSSDDREAVAGLKLAQQLQSKARGRAGDNNMFVVKVHADYLFSTSLFVETRLATALWN
ncbi:hypothetical protein HOE425_333163 [Hoeflea sp. EC-HK425]|nr:hypothetical protein HOE425_333163 [Hoeflea sp. EC-HK425]